MLSPLLSAFLDIGRSVDRKEAVALSGRAEGTGPIHGLRHLNEVLSRAVIEVKGGHEDNVSRKRQSSQCHNASSAAPEARG